MKSLWLIEDCNYSFYISSADHVTVFSCRFCVKPNVCSQQFNIKFLLLGFLTGWCVIGGVAERDGIILRTITAAGSRTMSCWTSASWACSMSTWRWVRRQSGLDRLILIFFPRPVFYFLSLPSSLCLLSILSDPVWLHHPVRGLFPFGSPPGSVQQHSGNQGGRLEVHHPVQATGGIQSPKHRGMAGDPQRGGHFVCCYQCEFSSCTSENN